MCIGPLSTVMMKPAARISRIICRSDVWLVSSTQFSGGSILRLDLPTTTTRVGANERQSSSIIELDSDLPSPRANGCNKIKGGYSSKREIGRASCRERV